MDQTPVKVLSSPIALQPAMEDDWMRLYYSYVLCHGLPVANGNLDSWTEQVLKNSFQSIIHAPTNVEHWETDIVGHTYDAAMVSLDGVPTIVGAAVLYRDIFYGIARDIMEKDEGDDEDRRDWRVSMECYFNDIAAYWKGRVYTKDSPRWEELSPYMGGLFQNRPVLRLLGGAADDGKVYFGAKGLVTVPADPDARILQATWIDPNSGEQTIKSFEATAAARVIQVSKDPIVLSQGSLPDPASVLYRVDELEATRGDEPEEEGKGEFVPSAQTLSATDTPPEQEAVAEVEGEEVDEVETIDYGLYRLRVERQSAEQVLLSVDYQDHEGEYHVASGYLVSDGEAAEQRAFLMDLLEESHKETIELVRELDAMIEATSGEADDEADDAEAKVWDTKYINNLPDAAFAVILPGGNKNGEGKTVPRSKRKLPHHNASVKKGSENGTVDLPHLRNALARLPVTDLPANAKKRAKSHLAAHARALLKDWKDEGAAAAAAAARNTSDERGDIAMTREEIESLLQEMLGGVDLGALAAQVEEHGETLKGHAAWISARDAEQRVAERLAQIGADTDNERLAKLAATLGDEDWEAVAEAITSAHESGDEPPAEGEAEAGADDEPPAEGDAEAAGDEPPAEGEAEAGADDEPPAEGDEPPAEGDAEAGADDEPPAEGEAEAGADDEPPAEGEAEAAGDEPPAQASQRPKVDPDQALFVLRTPDGRTVAGNSPKQIEDEGGYEATFDTLFGDRRQGQKQ